MNPHCFMIEVEPQPGNLLGAHVSKAISHIWLLSTDIKEARDIVFGFLKSDLWEVKEEKELTRRSTAGTSNQVSFNAE